MSRGYLDKVRVHLWLSKYQRLESEGRMRKQGEMNRKVDEKRKNTNMSEESIIKLTLS